jgi:DNA-binding SARP family transcriptional activator
MQRSSVQIRDNTDLKELSLLQKLAQRLPEDVDILKALAEAYTKSHLFEAGLKIDQQLSMLEPSNQTVWYNLACSYALTDGVDEAFEALAKAIDLGFTDYELIKGDSDLRILHDDPRYESLLGYIFSKIDSAYEEDG